MADEHEHSNSEQMPHVSLDDASDREEASVPAQPLAALSSLAGRARDAVRSAGDRAHELVSNTRKALNGEEIPYDEQRAAEEPQEQQGAEPSVFPSEHKGLAGKEESGGAPKDEEGQGNRAAQPLPVLRNNPLASKLKDAKLPPVVHDVAEAVRANPWWALSIVVSLAVAAFLIFAMLRPGGLFGDGADARTEVESRIDDITVYPSDAMQSTILGASALDLFGRAGMDYRAFYQSVTKNVKTEIKDVVSEEYTARVTVAATHPDVEQVRVKWLEKLSSYPSTDAEREEIRGASYQERLAKVLGLLKECFDDPKVALRTDLLSLTVNRGPNGWNIVTGGWERAAVLGGVDLAMMIDQWVVIDQPVSDEE